MDNPARSTRLLRQYMPVGVSSSSVTSDPAYTDAEVAEFNKAVAMGVPLEAFNAKQLAAMEASYTDEQKALRSWSNAKQAEEEKSSLGSLATPLQFLLGTGTAGISDLIFGIDKGINTKGGTWEKIAAGLDRTIDPGGTVDLGTRTVGDVINKIAPSITPYLQSAGATIGGIIGSIYLPGIGTVIGAGAGSGIGSKLAGGTKNKTYGNDLMNSAIAGGASYIGSALPISGMVGGAVAGETGSKVLGGIASGAVSGATSGTIGGILSGLTTGDMSNLPKNIGLSTLIGGLGGGVGTWAGNAPKTGIGSQFDASTGVANMAQSGITDSTGVEATTTAPNDATVSDILANTAQPTGSSTTPSETAGAEAEALFPTSSEDGLKSFTRDYAMPAAKLALPLVKGLLTGKSNVQANPVISQQLLGVPVGTASINPNKYTLSTLPTGIPRNRDNPDYRNPYAQVLV